MPSLLSLYLAVAPLVSALTFWRMGRPLPAMPDGEEQRAGHERHSVHHVSVPSMSVNPFINRTRILSVRMRLWMACMASTIFPIRLARALPPRRSRARCAVASASAQ